MTFELYSFRLHFSATKPIHFPRDGSGNVLRGALGAILRRIHCVRECPGQLGRPVGECELRAACRYARVFEPAPARTGPSGLACSPRSFVLRAAHLNGRTIAPGERFWFDLNLFETRNPNIEVFLEAFRQFANLLAVDQLGVDGSPATQPISISLDPHPAAPAHLRIRFQTPTELKGACSSKPEFAVLFARAQDRVSVLRELYGPGPVAADFKGMRARAAGVRMTSCELGRVRASRHSSRTGQVHSLGGFVGVAEYEGEVGEFLPYLEAARWTGVGRQCVWGKGELQIETVC